MHATYIVRTNAFNVIGLKPNNRISAIKKMIACVYNLKALISVHKIESFMQLKNPFLELCMDHKSII